MTNAVHFTFGISGNVRGEEKGIWERNGVNGQGTKQGLILSKSCGVQRKMEELGALYFYFELSSAFASLTNLPEINLLW